MLTHQWIVESLFISTGFSLQLSGLKHQRDFVENCFHTGGNFVWSDDCKDIHVQALVKPKSATSINILYTDLDVVKNSHMDS